MATRKDTFPMSEAIVKYAKAKDISSTDRAGKALRSRIRSLRANDNTRAAFEKAWPALTQRSKGDRYNEIPADVLEGLVSGSFSK